MLPRFSADTQQQTKNRGGDQKREADEHLSACVAASVCVLVFFVIALLVSYISSGYQVSAAFLKATQTRLFQIH